MTRKLNPSVFLTLDPIKDGGELLMGSGQDGYVYQLEVGESDDGDEIDGQWPTGWLDMDQPETEKMFVSVHADIEVVADRLYVDWSVDFGKATGTVELRSPAREGGFWESTAKTWEPATEVWGGPPNIQRKRLIAELPQEAEGQRIQLTLRAEDKVIAWQVTNVSVLYKVKDALTPMGDI